MAAASSGLPSKAKAIALDNDSDAEGAMAAFCGETVWPVPGICTVAWANTPLHAVSSTRAAQAARPVFSGPHQAPGLDEGKVVTPGRTPYRKRAGQNPDVDSRLCWRQKFARK